MEIPKYLVDALYQFSQEAIAEQEQFMKLQKQAEELNLADAIKATHKQSWLEHLFRASDSPKGY
jgi:hypothetical protein